LRPEVYRRLFSSWQNANVRALGNSVWISLVSVAGAGFLGTTLAYLLNRYDFPFRRLLASLAVIPLALPPLVGVIAFLFLYGESGILPRGLEHLSPWPTPRSRLREWRQSGSCTCTVSTSTSTSSWAPGLRRLTEACTKRRTILVRAGHTPSDGWYCRCSSRRWW